MNIAIVGCGYLGRAVAEQWTEKGFHVTATTRKPEKLSQLAQYAQKAVILKGNDEEEFVPLIANNELILVTTAADAPEHYESAYLHTAQIFKRLALEMDMPRDLIYTSSTSVYGDYRGQWVDESMPLLGKTEEAKILIEAEKTYMSLEEIGWNVCIFRLAHIYGEGRELSTVVRNLTKKSLSGSGDQYTNMVHKDDCVGAIQFAQKHALHGIFNLADDDHPTRRELYQQIAQKFHLSPIQWDPSSFSRERGNKRIANHKIKKAGYSFAFPHRVIL